MFSLYPCHFHTEVLIVDIDLELGIVVHEFVIGSIVCRRCQDRAVLVADFISLRMQ